MADSRSPGAALAPPAARGRVWVEPPRKLGKLKSYQLHVREDGRWEWLCTVEADTHAEAFHSALLGMGGEHYRKPIRVEQDTDGAYRKPCPPATRRD